MKDVIVVGGGTSGFIAAVSAARNGADVLILEKSFCLGGTITGGMVPGVVSLRHQPASRIEDLPHLETIYDTPQVAKGIGQEFVDRMVAAGAAYGKVGEPAVRIMFDPEVAKWVIDQMVTEADVDVLFNTKVTSVLTDGCHVQGVIVNGSKPFKAKVIIDATGDGDVSVLSGARYNQGLSGDPTLVQPMTFYFNLGGVNLDATIAYMAANASEFPEDYVRRVKQMKLEGRPFALIGFKSLREEALINNDYPIPYGTDSTDPKTRLDLCRPVFKNGRMRYDITTHNVDMAHKIDPTDIFDLSKAIIEMRKLTYKWAKYYQKYIPGYEDSYLLISAPMVGIRESRRIVGDYILNRTDVVEGRKFEDAIGSCGAVADIHDVKGEKNGVQLIEIGGDGKYDIPYRILLPKGIENLLVVGRCVSTDSIANSSIRQQAGCFVTAQAGGTAAAMASTKGITPRSSDIKEIQRILIDQGAILELKHTG